MEAIKKIVEGNSGRATPSLRYLQKIHKEIELNNKEGYFSLNCQNDQPEVLPNSK